jgi:tRNA-2-methylthio-N6-dimethylallyladenosine synthase
VYVRHGSTEDGKAIGETWSGHAVHVKTETRPGEYVKARITSAGPHVLYAEETAD